MTQYIVELQPKCWLAPWSGDPGRTTVINKARKFKKKSSAYRSLANVLDKKDFKDPKVLSVEICEECGGIWDQEKLECSLCDNDCPF